MSLQHTAPFVEEVFRRSQSARHSFHMPGHKQMPARNRQLAQMWGDGLFRSDLSEIGGLDYLHAPKSTLAQAQRLAAEAFGADFTFFLVNGSTAGNHASLLSSVRAGQKVLVPRASHRSVFAALLLSDAVPVYIPPHYHPEAGVSLAVDLEQMQKLLRAHPDIAAIQICSPSYYGATSDVAASAALAHTAGIPLLVDEAHGAHFGFHPHLPPSALQTGADLVVQSTHKTLGSLYQSSMLHGKQGIIRADRVQQILAMLQSSSPSTLLLASLDAARATLATEGADLLEHIVTLAEQARAEIQTLPGLWCYGSDLVGAGCVHGYDPTKLMIRVSPLNMTGYEAKDWLARGCGVEVELADTDHILCSLTLYDTEAEVAQLISALKHLVCQAQISGLPKQRHRLRLAPGIPLQAMRLREATFAPSKPCPLREAVHRICAESVVPYPPGIPALLPGEIIDAETVAYLEALVADGAAIVGTADPQLRTLQVVADGLPPSAQNAHPVQ